MQQDASRRLMFKNRLIYLLVFFTGPTEAVSFVARICSVQAHLYAPLSTFQTEHMVINRTQIV